MSRKQSRFLKQQKIVFIVAAILFLAIIGYVSIVVLKDAVPFGNYVAGEQYTMLENPRRVRGNRIEVIEFFSYACPYCYRLEPELVAWVDENQDRINLYAVPWFQMTPGGVWPDIIIPWKNWGYWMNST